MSQTNCGTFPLPKNQAYVVSTLWRNLVILTSSQQGFKEKVFCICRPVHLPMRCLLSVGSLSLSSNMAARTTCSTMRFIVEDAYFFLSDKVSPSVELRLDYVCVMDLGYVVLFVFIVHRYYLTIFKTFGVNLSF